MAIPPWVAHAEALPALPMAAALVHAHLGKQRYCAHVWENLEEYGRAGVVLRWEEEYGRTVKVCTSRDSTHTHTHKATPTCQSLGRPGDPTHCHLLHPCRNCCTTSFDRNHSSGTMTHGIRQHEGWR
eukprot:1158319-Pelagomonas_calceolata.AAC.4